MAIKITQIKETCIYVQDLDKSLEFYHEKLGLPLINFTRDRHVFFRAGSSVLLCFLAESTRNEQKLPPHYGRGNLHFAFEVDESDYDEAKNTLLEKGITIEQETNWKNLKSIYFRDPDDHLVEIVMKGIWG